MRSSGWIPDITERQISFQDLSPSKILKIWYQDFRIVWVQHRIHRVSLEVYIVYSGADTDINTAADFGGKNKTTAIVKFIETLLNKTYTVLDG
jgi:hypothetical protein